MHLELPNKLARSCHNIQFFLKDVTVYKCYKRFVHSSLQNKFSVALKYTEFVLVSKQILCILWQTECSNSNVYCATPYK